MQPPPFPDPFPRSPARRPEGPLLFRVAIIADTHVNEREDASASPYPANAAANARARFVVAQVNQAAPAFAIHLGDMVNPVPELPTHGEAVARFREIAERLAVPLHLAPGNHDIGDKPVAWMPAGTVDGAHVAGYRRHFGRDFHSFGHDGCHFVIIDAPLINSGEPEEAEQRAWLEADLAAHDGRRIFLFTHYPPYVSDPAEPGSYDNLDEPGRSWLLGLIRKHRVEAVFAAHVHNFWYDRIGPAEYYVVPSTCFVRHDYAEMYRVDSGASKGRDDGAKLGHVTLDIHARGHVARWHRSYGAVLSGDGEAPPAALRPHVKTGGRSDVFVDMRHAWAEVMTVAPSGAVDEFRRKQARNDYPVMALWEMGLAGLRVPLHDLEEAATRRRMAILADVGHVFQVHCYGVPDEAAATLLKEHRGLVGALELVLNWESADAALPQIRALAAATGIPVILSRVNRKDRAKHAGSRFNHLISHGFTLDEAGELAAFLAANPGLAAGAQFTIPRSVAPWSAARQFRAFADATGCGVRLYVKSTNANPAEAFEDDAANALRFAEAVLSAAGHGVPVVLDTLDDADRGYFVRTGLVDRRFNPRLAGQVISALVLALAGRRWTAADGDAPVLVGDDGRRLTVGAGMPPAGFAAISPLTGRPHPAGEPPDTPVSVFVSEPARTGSAS